MDEKILKELVATRNVLKKKLRSIKTGEIDTREQLRNTFKPITDPLNSFINNSKSINRIIKKEKNELKTEIERNNSSHIKKSSIKLETSTPKKLVEEPLFNISNSLNESNSNDDDDDDDDFYSQNSNIEESYTDLSVLQGRNELDTNYGPHKDLNNEWKFGDSNLKLNEEKIQVGGQIWALTPGLFSLMFHKIPKNYDKSELELYQKILISTNAYRRDYKPDGQIKGTKAYKYKHIIKKMFKEKNQETLSKAIPNKTITNYKGNGLMQFNLNKPNYIYWDDPNELVDRLRLLVSSQAAGHTNHNNEIVSIIEELREANIIE